MAGAAPPTGVAPSLLAANWAAEYMDWNIGGFVRVQLNLRADGGFERAVGYGEVPPVWYRTTGTWRVDGANLELSVVTSQPLPAEGEPGYGRPLPRTERYPVLAAHDKTLALDECTSKCFEVAYRRQ